MYYYNDRFLISEFGTTEPLSYHILDTFSLLHMFSNLDNPTIFKYFAFHDLLPYISSFKLSYNNIFPLIITFRILVHSSQVLNTIISSSNFFNTYSSLTAWRLLSHTSRQLTSVRLSFGQWRATYLLITRIYRMYQRLLP